MFMDIVAVYFENNSKPIINFISKFQRFLDGKICAASNKYFALNMNTSIEENLCGRANVSFSI